MVISRRAGIALFVVLGGLLIGGAYYCVRRGDEDVLFVDWISTATRAQVWLFLWGAVVSGVACGRQFGGR